MNENKKPTVELVNGDALETLLKLGAEGRKFDALITDPPYCSGGVSPASRYRSSNNKYFDTENFMNFDDGQDQFALWYSMRASLLAARLCLKTTALWALFTDWRQYPFFFSVVQSCGFSPSGVVVWHKSNARPVVGCFQSQCEFVIYGFNGEKPNKYHRDNLLEVGIKYKNKMHPTEKSVDGLKKIMELLPDDAKSVIDPFAGSGSTGAACRDLGLDFTGVELSKHYFDIMSERLSQE